MEDFGGDYMFNFVYWILFWKYKMIEVFYIISSSDIGLIVWFFVNEVCNFLVLFWNCLIISFNINVSLRLYKNVMKLVVEGKNKFYFVGIFINCNL